MLKNSAFTILEILIVITLLTIIATVGLIIFNPLQQLKKGMDGKRKSDLSQLNKALESYYNDKNCYPTGTEICYDTPQLQGTSYICHVCGSESGSPRFEPYLPDLPCDPQHSRKRYLYHYNDVTCPNSYGIYSEFSIKDDPAVETLGCSGGACGPAPRGYDYGVTSPNTSLAQDYSFVCLEQNVPTDTCGSCGSYLNCLTRSSCLYYSKFYPSAINCCENNPQVNCTLYWCRTGSECYYCGTSLDCAQDDRCAKPVQKYSNPSCT